MKSRRAVAVLGIAALAVSVATSAAADDGLKVMKTLSDRDPVLAGYVDEAEHAFTGMMKFYVPAQAANGVLYAETEAGGLPYFYDDGNEEADETRGLAKPLVSVFMDGPAEGVDGTGFIGHGLRDAYAAVSLDDGVTWKDTNLSESAEESSIDIPRDDIQLYVDAGLVTPAETEGEVGTTAYPGDVINMFHAIAGNKVVVAWPSRFCSQGQPNYSMDSSEEGVARRAAIAEYLGINLDDPSPEDIYLLDMYGVAGSQGTVDYLDDKWEENHPAGEVPFACLWTARGELVNGDDPRTEEVIEASFMRWYNTERLTSGARDVNRIEVMGVQGAGFAITWQEDPDGLRPGQGEGPGEGWSGAIANSGTDVWYSYIDWEDFSIVQDPTVEDGTAYLPLTAEDFTPTAGYESLAAAADVTQKPKPFVPFAMPMRMTDNEKCNVENPKPYCYGSALAASGVPVPTTTDLMPLNPLDYGLKDMCESIIQVPTGKQDTLSDVCVSADGLPNLGNTAATRPRLGLYGYDSTGKVKDAVIDSAFVTVILEEDKGLGKFGFHDNDLDGTVDYTDPCTPVDKEDDPDYDATCIPFDEGKNIWYHSFGMSLTDAMVAEELDGLLDNLTSHGNMLNQPEVNWQTGEFYGDASTEYMWNLADAPVTTGDPVEDFSIYNTEIARRGSLLGQDIYKVHNATSKAKNGLLLMPMWKQGTMNQGGPADVMTRQIVIPKGWNVRSGGPNGGNPYAFRNMACDEWIFEDGSNPQYPEGVCVQSPLNLSGSIPDTCVDSTTGEAIPCPQVDLSQGTTFGIGDTNPFLQGKEADDPTTEEKETNTTKALTWHQCPAGGTVVSQTDGVEVLTCDTDSRTDASTLRDQSWYNPLEVAKGHRGFLDGDFVMMLYAWSPNWRLNVKGSDRYELYIRRSFDGGTSWTNLPSAYTHWDGTKFGGQGTVVCETYRTDATQQQGESEEPRVCYAYPADKIGTAEQARDVTQHKSMRITTLDPRYAMTGAPQGVSVTSDLFGNGLPGYTTLSGDIEDVRDPSRYFVVYETGDNTTTEFGEPEPLDLFYSRAVNFGDDYVVWDELAESTRDGSRDVTECYPNNAHEDDDVVGTVLEGSGFCNEFDKMESGTPGLEASEASMTANPGGQFLYAAWAQAQLEDGEVIESDAMERRVWYVDEFIPISAWIFGQGAEGETGSG